jgi:hypothetical protein
MLKCIVSHVSPECLDRVLALPGRLGRSWKWVKFLSHCQDLNVQGLPTYTKTRWYSLYKVLHHTLILWPHIQEFLQDKEGGPLSEEILPKLERFKDVVATFRNATACLESDKFGTLSRVYDWLSLIKMSCTRDPEWSALSNGWTEAYTKHQVRYLGGEEPGPPLGASVGDQLLSERLTFACLLNPSANYPFLLSQDKLVYFVARLRVEFERVRSSGAALGPHGDVSSQEPGSSGGAEREARPPISGMTLTDLRSVGPLATTDELDQYLNLDKGGLRALGDLSGPKFSSDV